MDIEILLALYNFVCDRQVKDGVSTYGFWSPVCQTIASQKCLECCALVCGRVLTTTVQKRNEVKYCIRKKVVWGVDRFQGSTKKEKVEMTGGAQYERENR